MSAGPGPGPLDLRPYDGIGPVLLGMTREAVEEAVGQLSLAVDKGDPLPVAAFPGIGLHAHFAEDGSCSAIEVMTPAEPTLDAHSPLTTPYRELLGWLIDRDPDLEAGPDGLTSEALGIGLYAPHNVDMPELPPESAIVFVRGYYDD